MTPKWGILWFISLGEIVNNRHITSFCSNECPVGTHIGLIKVDGTGQEQLGLIMLSIIDSLNNLAKLDLPRLIEISMDGVIDETEADDFNQLKKV